MLSIPRVGFTGEAEVGQVPVRQEKLLFGAGFGHQLVAGAVPGAAAADAKAEGLDVLIG